MLWRCDPTRVMASSILMFLDHTQRRTTVGRTPLDEWSARRRDLYLTTHNTHNRQVSMPPVGFEPTISAGERPQTYALDRTANGTGKRSNVPMYRSKREVRCSVQYRSTELNEASWRLKTWEKIYFHLTTRNGWSKRTWANFLFHHCFGFSLLSNTSPPHRPPKLM